MSLVYLQQQMGVTADGVIGPQTLKAMSKYFNLSPVRTAHFAAQCSHETGEFKRFVENLNYSANGLRTTFKKYFPTLTLANQYAYKPEMIANRVYANRMKNGNEASGDGWKFRGRGALQLTGRENYEYFAVYKNDQSVLTHPDLVATKYSFDSAKFFFDKNKLWSICDQGITDQAILNLTKRINGGTNGLSHRKELTKKYAKWLGL